ncbi:carboxypeptidase regulatory-like domain-containing protein [bacterium]|nr:carboxypeptidase regulatory-like domain-containing protein [bacterium]
MKLNRCGLLVVLVAGALVFTMVGNAADTKGRLFVIISDTNGDPIKDVKITLTSVESKEKSYDLVTKKNGKAMIVGLDPDLYTVRAEKDGYQFMEGRVKLRPGVNVKHKWTMKTVEEAKAEAIEKALEGMTEEERQHVFAEEAHNRGFEAYQKDDFETAKTEFLKAVELDPDIHYFDHLILGQMAFNEKNLPEAQKYLEKARELDTENVSIKDIGSLLGATYMIQEDYVQAKEVWSKQVEVAPDPTVLFNLAGIEVRNKALDDAIVWLKISCEKFPEYTESIQLMGDIYIQKENYPEALNSYKLLLTAMQAKEGISEEALKEISDTVKLLEETAN